MFSLFVVLASQVVPTISGLAFEATVEIPKANKYSQASGAIPAAAPNDSIAFRIPVHTPRMGTIVFRYDAEGNRIEQIPGDYGFQEDCGNGLVSVVHLVENPKTRSMEGKSATTYDVATGKKLSHVDTDIERVGRFGVERSRLGQSGPDRRQVFDLTTGKVIAVIGRYSNVEGYVGKIVWDDPKLGSRPIIAEKWTGDAAKGQLCIAARASCLTVRLRWR